MDFHTFASAKMADYQRMADSLAQESAAVRLFRKPRKQKRSDFDHIPPRKPVQGPVFF
jgi:hypothetical protein